MDVIADPGPGDHLCCLYETEEEHRAVLTPFLRQGLDRGEKVVYIVDAHTAETVLGYLRDDGLEVEPYLASGQLSILTVDDAYMREGVFEPDGMMALLRAETERALAEGYPALRVTGEMTWAPRGLPGSERLIEYEAKLNEFFPGSNCLAICQYDRRRFNPAVLLDVLSTHPIAVIGTEVYDNFYYIPPAEFLGHDFPAAKWSHWVQNLAERKRAEEALRESEERYRRLIELSPDGIMIVGAEETIHLANPAMLRMLSAENGQAVIGKKMFGFIVPEEFDHCFACFAGVIADPSQHAREETLFVRLGGQAFPVEVDAGHFAWGGKPAVQIIVRDITERKRAEEELQESEEKYRTILDNIEDGYFEVDNAGNFTFFNDSLCGIIGYSTDEMMGMNNRQYMDKDNAKKVFQAFNQVHTTGKPTKGFDWEIVRKDGTRRFVEASASLIRDSEGEPIGFRGIVRDITERKQAEEEIRRRADELAALYDISLDVAAQLDTQQLLHTIVERATRLLNAKAGGIYLYDPTKREIELQVSYGLSKDYTGIRLALGEGLSGKVAQTGEPLIVGDYQQWERRSPLWEGEVIGGVLGVPLKHGDDLLGVLTIDHAPGKTFHEGDVRLATLFASQAGLAIENARLYEQTRQRTSELSTLDLVGLTLASTRDLLSVLDLIVESCQQLTGTPGVHIFLYDEIAGEFTHGAGRWDLEQKEPALRMPRKGGVSDTVAKQGKPLVINDARNHPLYSSPEAQSWGINAVAGFPLQGAEALLGVLYVAFFTPHTFVEDELRVLSLLANLATAAIENAQAYQRLKTLNLETISALAAAVEAKDPYTRGHSEEVTQFAIAIAEKMGLSHDEIEDLQVAALLHDIGKIGIPDSVLNKPARLTSAEFLMVKTHPIIAAEIVGKIEALVHLVPIIRHHHERYDGQGYPDGLKGKEIPLGARILAVADGFEAMTSERPYRRARTEEEALAELQKGAGTQWDPQVVEVFVKTYEEGALKHQAGGQ